MNIYGVIAVAGAVVIAGAQELWKRRRSPSPQPQPQPPTPTTPKPSAPPRPRTGRVPHPAATIIDLPGGALRLVDVRALPRDDLRAARLGVVQQQLALERPVRIQIWVVDLATARDWAAMGETSRSILPGRLRDPRGDGGSNYLYAVGGVLSEAEGAALAAGGVQIITSMTNLADPPRALEDFLSPCVPWQPSTDDRPALQLEIVSGDPLDSGLIYVVREFAFVDLRRASPDAIRNGVALERIEKALAALRREPLPAYVIWVAAPWALELLSDADVGRVESMVASLGAGVQQRLAIVHAEGEPVPAHGAAVRLGGKLPPIAEWVEMGTETRGSFLVSPLDMLHDAYFTRAWKQPRL
jgi:hypothetical protein